MMQRFITRLLVGIAIATAAHNINATNARSWWHLDFLKTCSVVPAPLDSEQGPEKSPTFLTKCRNWMVPCISIIIVLVEHEYALKKRNEQSKEFNDRIVLEEGFRNDLQINMNNLLDAMEIQARNVNYLMRKIEQLENSPYVHLNLQRNDQKAQSNDGDFSPIEVPEFKQEVPEQAQS